MISSCITVLSYGGVLESQESHVNVGSLAIASIQYVLQRLKIGLGLQSSFSYVSSVAPVEAKSPSRLALIM
jgi:hypothetical protein